MHTYPYPAGIPPVASASLSGGPFTVVFSNLLNNAMKYSDGDLDITLSEPCNITFTNTASGLNEVQVGKLFDRFYTVEAASIHR